MMNFIEDVNISNTRTTSDGYLVADVRCARTGIQQYAGYELGLPTLDVVNVYRPESQVFDKKSLSTFVGKPVTDDHPSEYVDASNWKDYAVGSIGEGVLRDGEYVRVPITLMDADVISKIKAGKREISMGYSSELKFESGVTDSGESYDAIMTDLAMNHLAIVDKGRAGKACRVGDDFKRLANSANEHKKGVSRMTDSLRRITVDGFSVETNEQGFNAIEKLNKSLAEQKSISDAELKAKVSAHDAEMAAKDKTLAEKDAKISDLESKVLSQDAIDKLVADRVALVSSATKLNKDAKFDGLSDQEIKLEALKAVRSEDSLKDKSEAYIAAAFDLAMEDLGKTNKVAKSIESRDNSVSVADNGYSAYKDRLKNAWKKKGVK